MVGVALLLLGVALLLLGVAIGICISALLRAND